MSAAMAEKLWAVHGRTVLKGSGSLHYISGHASRESARRKALRIVTADNEGNLFGCYEIARVSWHGMPGFDPRTDAERADDNFRRVS